MLDYWTGVIREAHKLTWHLLFGSLRRIIVETALFLLATALLAYSGRKLQMTDQLAWLGAIGGAAAIMYGPMFIWHLLGVPYLRFERAQTDIERLRILVGTTKRAPSFDIGFEMCAVSESYEGQQHYGPEEVCRIWVENLEPQQITDCRVVVENLAPNFPVRNGAMLLPDNRGSEQQETARFDLAVTEKAYLSFLQLESRAFWDKGPALSVRTDHDAIGFYAGIKPKAVLEFGQTYFATIAVHGKNSNSRRMDLRIDAASMLDIRVSERPPSVEEEFEVSR